MRHRMKIKKLGRPTAHRVLMLKNQTTKLFMHGRLETTEAKAKETKKMAEKTLTAAKENTLAAKRRVRRVINDPAVFKKIFEVYAPKYQSRPGGYLSLVKLPPRRGDGAEMALLVFVD